MVVHCQLPRFGKIICPLVLQDASLISPLKGQNFCSRIFETTQIETLGITSTSKASAPLHAKHTTKTCRHSGCVCVCVRLHVCNTIVSLHICHMRKILFKVEICISNGFPIVCLSFFMIHLKRSRISFINSKQHPGRDFFCCLEFKIPLIFWPKKGIVLNDSYTSDTPTLDLSKCGCLHFLQFGS